MFRRPPFVIASAALASASLLWICSTAALSATAQPVRTATPIKHLVVIYGENVSFDHYFGTYPHAANPDGEPKFVAVGMPALNGLDDALLAHNPNATNERNGGGESNPFRLDRAQAATADQSHAYTAEQQAYDDGHADLFPKYTGKGSNGAAGAFGTTGQVMGYFDGNTVTALWNYAQNYAMSDNAYTSTYGPSTPGALNLVSGQTNGMRIVHTTKAPFTNDAHAHSYYVDDAQGGFTMINDVDPGYDVCSSKTDQVMMSSKNIGDLLNARGVTWGGFMGGFDLTVVNDNGTTGCSRSSIATAVGRPSKDYIAHHNWFQYYASTSNPQHLRPSSLSAIGHSFEADSTTPEPANHEYDLDDFFAAIKAGNFPAVSFLKAPADQDAHAGYSDPLDEQVFLTKVVNFLQQRREWKDTAVIVTYDDSDGWYDHAYAAPIHASFDPQADQLNGAGKCGTGAAPLGVEGAPVNGRCGPGTRIPFLVISPWAKKDYVDHTPIVEASVTRFIEDNWLDSERIGDGSFDAQAGSIMDMFDFKAKKPRRDRLVLDPTLGTPVKSAGTD